ncbi:MAG: Type pilus assembly protein PilC [Verrucomicrobiaceae bacterium]|nr:Type pilus assembly protein PilC [Verrucomicrobiaceae bacterium]
MPSFTYTALNPTGQQVSGKLQVGTRAEAFRKLEAQSLTPMKVLEEAGAASTSKGKATAQAAAINEQVKLKRGQLITFTEELADLLDGGLQIDQALRVMEDRQDSPAVKKISGILRNEIREGSTISKALKRASPSFDDMYINMMAAGEASGSLPEILRRQAANLSILHELQSKVTQAMIYPSMLTIACIGMIIVFTTVVVPQITSLLGSTGSKLPLATEILIKVSSFLAQWWLVMLSVGVVAFLSFRAYINTPVGRMWWASAKMKIPLLGPVVATRLHAQFAHSLGNLVVNGVPLLNALKLASKAMTNVFMQNQLSKALALVGEGASLSNALRKVGEFPTLLVDMVAVGEQTGMLGRSLEKTAARYDKELDIKINRLTTFISPAIMVFMAVIVGTVAYSIVTAVFSTSQGIHSHV